MAEFGVRLAGFGRAQAGVARACGLRVFDFEKVGLAIHGKSGPNFCVAKVDAEKIALVLPPREGALLKARFRRALLGEKADLE